MVEPGRVQGRWPSPVPRCTSAKIITRIAFWLPSACGIAPTPMKAPGFTSASVARTTPNTPALSVSVTRCFVALAARLDHDGRPVDADDGADDANGLLLRLHRRDDERRGNGRT